MSMITESLRVVKLNINLCGSKFVVVMINVDGSQEFLTGLLVIHKLSIWDNTIYMEDDKMYQNDLSKLYTLNTFFSIITGFSGFLLY